MVDTYISIHAPREGSDMDKLMFVFIAVISIHAPREGSDVACISLPVTVILFQSTPPARGATLRYGITWLFCKRISIHAPREGSDNSGSAVSLPCRNFNPRPPRGERRQSFNHLFRYALFQSTPPARGAT